MFVTVIFYKFKGSVCNTIYHLLEYSCKRCIVLHTDPYKYSNFGPLETEDDVNGSRINQTQNRL